MKIARDRMQRLQRRRAAKRKLHIDMKTLLTLSRGMAASAAAATEFRDALQQVNTAAQPLIASLSLLARRELFRRSRIARRASNITSVVRQTQSKYLNEGE